MPAHRKDVPKKVTPTFTFMSRCPLILGNEAATLRRTVTDWLALAGPPPKPVMEFDNVETIISLMAVGLDASLVPRLSWAPGHVPVANLRVVPISPRAKRRIGLVKLKGRQNRQGVKLVAMALATLSARGNLAG